MDVKTVVVDSLVVKWTTDKRIRELLIGKNSRLPAKDCGGVPCSVELKDNRSEQLKKVPTNIPEVQYGNAGSPSEKEADYYGPIWYESSQSLYIGHFSGKEKQGRGLLIGYADHKMVFCYEGYFRHDKQDGTGRVFYANGDWYSGEFKEGHANGLGEYRNNTCGSLYVGHFNHDLPEGHGKETWDDGAVYVGDFEKGKKHGRGKFVVDGLILEGSFLRGGFHGEGSLTSKNKRVFEGSWQESVLQSPARIHYNGAKYEGDINNQYLPHGKGKVQNNEKVIIGNFTQGVLDGDATKTDALTGKSSRGYYEKGILTSAFRDDAGMSEYDDKVKIGEVNKIGMIQHTPEGKHRIPAPVASNSDKPTKKKFCFCC